MASYVSPDGQDVFGNSKKDRPGASLGAAAALTVKQKSHPFRNKIKKIVSL